MSCCHAGSEASDTLDSRCVNANAAVALRCGHVLQKYLGYGESAIGGVNNAVRGLCKKGYLLTATWLVRAGK